MDRVVFVFFLICVIAVWAEPLATVRRQCSAAQSSPTAALQSEAVLYEVCAEVGDITYYCPGDQYCCIPGSPTSGCCPDGTMCIGTEYCCQDGYPQVCGDYCCTSTSYCCNDQFCCASEEQCCAPDQCCSEQTPCCSGPEEKTCCDKDEMACCGDEYGCVAPCDCPFEAVGCYVESTDSIIGVQAPPKVDCPNPLESGVVYRILREVENCNTGLLAKNPAAEKTVLSHVNCGSKNNYASQYISCSSSIEVVNYYKAKLSPEARVAVIDIKSLPTGCEIYDLTSEAERNKYLKNAVCKNFAKASCEVLLSCGTAPVPCTYSNTKDEL